MLSSIPGLGRVKLPLLCLSLGDGFALLFVQPRAGGMDDSEYAGTQSDTPDIKVIHCPLSLYQLISSRHH